MKRLAVLTALVIAVLSFGAPDVSAQDDRYAGYPQSLVGWPKTLPNLQTCFDQEYYEPQDTHLMKYTRRVKIAGHRIQETDECVWMRTRNGDRYVLRPKGTKVAQDSQGRDLFDFGSPKGEACGNPRPFSYGQRAHSAPVVRIPEPEPERRRVVVPRDFPPPPEEVWATPPLREEKKGRKKWPWVVGGVIGGAIVGGVVYYYWPCPPGTVRRW